MHIVHSAFALNHDDALQFAVHRGFGLLTAFDGQRPIGSHLPFIVRRDPAGVIVQAHVSQSNPLGLLADGRPFLLAVSGIDAYISNDYYASRDQISTWLYEAVHITGPTRRLSSTDNRNHGDALLQTFENRLAPKMPWHLDVMDPDKRSAMLNAIVTVEMTVTTVEGQRKFNQHKPDADHIAVVQALERSADQTKVELALRLRNLRPQLAYD